MPEHVETRSERLWARHLRHPVAAIAEARTLLEDPALGARERAWSHLTLGYHQLFSTAQPREARAALDHAQAAFRDIGDRRGQILAETGLARLQIIAQQPEAARDALAVLYVEAAKTLPPGDRFWVINALGAAHFFTDRIDEAIRYLHEALETLRSIEHSPQLPIVMSNLAAALVTVGDYLPARELAQDALGLLPHYDNPQLLLFARSNLAEALLGSGGAEEARGTVDALYDEIESPNLGATQNHFCAVAAEVYAQQGELQRARRCMERAQAIHAEHPGGYNAVHASWSAAVLADADEDGNAALAAFDDALATADRAGHLPTLCKASERAALRAARLGRFEHAYRMQVTATAAQARRHTSRASVKYYLLKAEQDLQHARAARDRAERQRQESDAINRQLEHLNSELNDRMREVQQLQARLASEAVRDPLTDLFNRRYLDMVFPGLLAAALRREAPLALTLVDLDHFKRVNDEHGHPIGDRVLAAIGELFGTALRPSDLSCRYGGEEFCIVLPDTDAAGARRVLDMLATRLHELTIDYEEIALTGFTFSAGIAVYPLHGRGFSELVTAADRALYVAKNSGRNRIVVAATAERRTA
ncbi:MAG: tetratricopeptide repeat-containing diguanylate cyclase [Casimicrobiaceae bacterium]